MTSEQNKQVVIRFNDEFFTKGDTSVLQEILADTFVNHAAPPNTPKDANGMIRLIVMGFQQAFSDRILQIDDIFCEGGKVCTRISVTAVHTGDFMGKAPTGKKVMLNWLSIDLLKEGKITDHWSQNNIMQVLQSV